MYTIFLFMRSGKRIVYKEDIKDKEELKLHLKTIANFDMFYDIKVFKEVKFKYLK